MPYNKLAQEMFTSKLEAQRVMRNFRLIAGAVVCVLMVGTVFYHYIEDMRWIDAFYFCAVSLTTVGYGDFTPKTDAGKLFTVLYLFIGIGIIAAFVNNLLRSRIARRATTGLHASSKQKTD